MLIPFTFFGTLCVTSTVHIELLLQFGPIGRPDIIVKRGVMKCIIEALVELLGGQTIVLVKTQRYPGSETSCAFVAN